MNMNIAYAPHTRAKEIVAMQLQFLSFWREKLPFEFPLDSPPVQFSFPFAHARKVFCMCVCAG